MYIHIAEFAQRRRAIGVAYLMYSACEGGIYRRARTSQLVSRRLKNIGSNGIIREGIRRAHGIDASMLARCNVTVQRDV